MSDPAKQRLADDDSSQTNDDRATAHADICKALILAQQSARQRHQTVGHSQTQHDIEVSVDALRTGHGGVRAGGTDGTAQLGAEEPVQNADQHRCDNDDHNDRVVESELLDPAQGDQQVVLVHVDGLIGFAHDFEVNGIQRKLGQDAGKDGRNAHKCVQDTGDEAGQQACQQRHEQGDPDVLAGQQAHDAHCTAGAKGAVHGQIGHVQNTVGQVHANGHDTPDKALCTGTRQSARQVCQSCNDFQNNSS